MKLEVKIFKHLHEFDLDVKFCVNEETLGLIGASGSGKSMTLKCIAGIETPDYGRIVLNGQILYDSELKINLSPQKRNIGYMFQDYALFPNMNVYENIAAPLIARKLDKETVKIKVNKMIDTFCLNGNEKRYPNQLSGGQKQRVALARLLVYDAKVLLLDEPFSALDEDLKIQLLSEMKEHLNKFNHPCIFVSHIKEEINYLSDKVYKIKKGKVKIETEDE